MKCVGKDPCPSTPYVPLAAPPKPAVSVWAHWALTAGIKTTCERAVTPTTIKTSERPRHDSLGYITRGEVCYERRQAFCALSLSNTTMANALVSHRVALWCCWAQLAVWAAVETEREPTRSLQLCFQIKGKLKAPANFVTFFFFFGGVWKWAHTLAQATSQRQERMRGKGRVSKQETVRGRWKKKKKARAVCMCIDGYLPYGPKTGNVYLPVW